MSPRRLSPTASGSHTRSASPYQNRQASAHKSSKKREQFSACGACRMRRVRCDLKDLPPSSSGQPLSCSNCKERGIKCIDEFAEVKAVKILRRGRRLQQVEALYGKVPEETNIRSLTPPPNVIPRLAPEFFDSPFFRRFQVQRPVLEPIEFRLRYTQFYGGNIDALQSAGQLIAMALVIWAASFGLNEQGVAQPHESPAESRQRKEQVQDMLKEILYLVDLHGILRRTSWDGVSLLLLLLPLTQETLKPLDRLAIYESTLNQIYNLCRLTSESVDTGQGSYIDALVRGRIFWHAYVVDGAISALRGGRVILTDDDLTAFEHTLPSQGDSTPGSALYGFTFRCVTIPIRISSACRDINAVLTSPRARRVDHTAEEVLKAVWDTLDRCWTELEGLRQSEAGGFIECEDLERLIHGWQIFIYECHNVIREALKKKVEANHRTASPGEQERLVRLYESAKMRCHKSVYDVVAIFRKNLGTAFFQYDACLIRDGCFYAAFLLAGEAGSSEDVEVCLKALDEMRWVFSKSDERIHTVKMVWQSRAQPGRGTMRPLSASPSADPLGSLVVGETVSRTAGRNLSIPPLTLTAGIPIRSSSAPSTAHTEDGSWSSDLSAGPSRPNSLPAVVQQSLHNSPATAILSPSYLHSPQSSIPVLPEPSGSHRNLLPSTSLLVTPTQDGHIAYDRSTGGAQPGYYYPRYEYTNSSSNSMGDLSHPQPSLPISSYAQTQYVSSNTGYPTFPRGYSGDHVSDNTTLSNPPVEDDPRTYPTGGYY